MNFQQLIKQKSYEKIIYTLHRHWLNFAPIVILFILMLAVPVVLYFLLNTLFPHVLYNAIIFPVAVILASIYYLTSYLFFFVRFIDYYLDVWIVTNDRIIDIEQHGLFNRVTTELDLYRIQDVTAEIDGVFRTIFRYGDIVVSTASTNTSIIFKSIPYPDMVRERLIRLADEDRKYHYAQADTIHYD